MAEPTATLAKIANRSCQADPFAAFADPFARALRRPLRPSQIQEILVKSERRLFPRASYSAVFVVLICNIFAALMRLDITPRQEQNAPMDSKSQDQNSSPPRRRGLRGPIRLAALSFVTLILTLSALSTSARTQNKPSVIPNDCYGCTQGSGCMACCISTYSNSLNYRTNQYNICKSTCSEAFTVCKANCSPGDQSCLNACTVENTDCNAVCGQTKTNCRNEAEYI